MITKALKGTTFNWNEEKRLLSISANDEEIVLSRIHAFSLVRFLVRIFQKPLRKKQKEVKKNESS